MTGSNKGALALGFATLICATPAWGQVPTTMGITGRLADEQGPMTGSVSVQVAIYDAETAGTLVWEESFGNVQADAGLVFLTLGETTPLDETVFDGTLRHVEFTVNGHTMAPRLSIQTVPYAVRASTAATVGGLGPEDLALQGHDHDGDYSPASHIHSYYADEFHEHSVISTCGWVTQSTAATSLTASCPAGRRIVSGGCSTSPAEPIISSRRSGEGWRCMTAYSTTLYVEAYCCD